MPATLDGALQTVPPAAPIATFCASVERSQGGLFALCLRLLGNEEDARDALQEGLLKAYQHLGQFEARASMSTWLYTIVKRACYDELRRRRRLPLPQDPQQFTVVPTWRPDPGEAVEQRELCRSIHRAIGTLSPVHREVLVLRALLGLSSTETAGRLRVPDGTIRSRMHRACVALRHALTASRSHPPFTGSPEGGRRPGRGPVPRGSGWRRCTPAAESKR